MKRENYFPNANADRRAWAVKYKANIVANGVILGMTPEQITAEIAFCDAIIDAIDAAELSKAAAKQQNKNKEDAIKTAMDSMRPNIKGHKANAAYTDGIGEALGVIGTEITFDPSTAKTIVMLSKDPQGVDIKFGLELCEGGNIYCKRGNEEAFTFIKYIIHPHTIDTRPNLGGAASERREYYVTLVMDDREVGIPSDTANIKN